MKRQMMVAAWLLLGLISPAATLMAGENGFTGTLSYGYNALGQRTSKTVNGTTTYYLYGLHGERIAEVDSNGNVTREYLYLDGQPLAQVDNVNTENEKIHYSHNDHLGAPLMLTDQNQNVVWQAVRTPFGEIVEEETNGQVMQQRGFPGQYHDRETATDYNYFRDYDPALGRYVQSDPIGLRGGINTYSYVANNPVVFIDPYGLEVKVVTNDPQAEKILQEAYARLNTTKRGMQICDQLEKSSETYQIMTTTKDAFYCPDGGAQIPECQGQERTVFIDPYNNVSLQEATGLQPASKASVLGHELGHAIGDADDGANDMNNVNKNENPIRKGLGEPMRTAYPVPQEIWTPGTK